MRWSPSRRFFLWLFNGQPLGLRVLHEAVKLSADGYIFKRQGWPMTTPLGLIMMTDVTRFPDWRAAVQALPPGSAVILRDYDHTARAALAREMADFCRAHHMRFLVAGDAALATRLGVGFHCPSYLLARQPQLATPATLNRQGLIATAAVHNFRDMVCAARMGFRQVILSPAFATTSHPGAPSLGPVRFLALARAGHQIGLTVFALGGMNEKKWARLAGGHDVLAGLAAISFFQSLKG
jgi:thiamine-phosphate pyrophosphorylase